MQFCRFYKSEFARHGAWKLCSCVSRDGPEDAAPRFKVARLQKDFLTFSAALRTEGGPKQNTARKRGGAGVSWRLRIPRFSASKFLPLCFFLLLVQTSCPEKSDSVYVFFFFYACSSSKVR